MGLRNVSYSQTQWEAFALAGHYKTETKKKNYGM